MLPTLIEKGLAAARAPTRGKTVEILLEFVATDSAEPIVVTGEGGRASEHYLLIFYDQTALGECLTHKQPKLVAACVAAITEIVRYAAMWRV